MVVIQQGNGYNYPSRVVTISLIFSWRWKIALPAAKTNLIRVTPVRTIGTTGMEPRLS